MTTSGPVVVARGLTRAYGTEPVVEDVDLDVFPGEVLGLIGPNGGGKSTLLLLLAGLVRPDAGDVRVLGRPAHALAREVAGTVGLITASPGLYPSLTVRENLAFFAGLYGRALDPALLGPLTERLDLAGQLDVRAGALSSGQQQKVSLVRALLLEPSVLLFDEPTANLDPLAASVLHRELRRLAASGRAVVLCTHDLHAAEPVCDRVAVLNRTLRGVHLVPGERRAPAPGALHGWFEAAL